MRLLGSPAAAAAACAAVAALTACGDGGVTVVTVRARPAVKPVERLEVTVENGDSTQSQRFAVDGRAFPLTFSVETRDRAGELGILVAAEDAAGETLARGATRVAIDPDDQSDAEVMLDPTDFPVNTVYPGDQRLAFRPDAPGRQLAVSPQGVATIGWTDSCQVGGACPVLGRRFDATGTAVVTAAAASADQFTINRTSGGVGFEPSLATSADGVTLAVWSDDVDLLAVAIDAAGATGPATETRVATGTTPSTPAVTALPTGRFVVTWTEPGVMAGQFLVKARYLDATGLPTTNPVTNNADAYLVSTTPLPVSAPPAVVALGDASAHAIVWRAGSSVRGRFYGPNGQARGATDAVLAGYPAEDLIGEPQAVRVDGDVVLAFGHLIAATGSTPEIGELVLRRVNPMGNRVGIDGYATRDVAPRAVGATARADGAIAVSWTACDSSTGDGLGCGVRVQLFRPTLAPVGPSFLANTTTANDQGESAIAGLPDGAFIATWTDASGKAPDVNGLAVRARILYPPYDDARGILGARCTGTPECGEGNVCMPGSDDTPRCYRTCTAGACPAGGSCTTLGTESGCLY